MKFTLLSCAVFIVSSVYALPSAPLSRRDGDFISSSSADNRIPTRTILYNNIYAPQTSPAFPNLDTPSGVISTYAGAAASAEIDTSAPLSRETLDLSKYPEPWSKPDTNHPEVQAMVKAIQWDYVPNIAARKVDKEGNVVMKGYDANEDPDCWWTSSNCLEPKVNYLPPDVYTCPNQLEWGLTYDDGPFALRDDDEEDAKQENPYAEPRLYNFLADQGVKSTLFYIGSNVVAYPAAAKRALNDGHSLCVHTWSHPAMTTQSNEEVVAELYWTQRAIKEATGVTPKCWRPPQGDVDDRVRAIAWQMGMRTVIWDKDTFDWNMPAPGGGNLPPATVDGYFKGWLHDAKSGKDANGTVILEHELNHATVQMAEKWLPKVKETFKVLPALQCNDITQPYWEEDFTYPSAH
ncbi:hypothetical protein BDF20DRAFT_856389 [Mycotypha africana]|uniref:uncharacterized protein n=1 Tax=Mycotypha africana TaxID=64632 RepID=UPI0022FFE7A3|nr:uncharacterized protein BDF20DRAFT_856389 [Mycotypha africana]KAI8988555.1 hypothetical protein BDF20DRAFT_856389 [Mycotypha africana]